jgi:hypothetical protein
MDAVVQIVRASRSCFDALDGMADFGGAGFAGYNELVST